MPTYRNNSTVPLKLLSPTGSVTVKVGATVDSPTPPTAYDRKGNRIKLERVSDEAVKKAAPAVAPKETKKKEAQKATKPAKKRRWGK